MPVESSISPKTKSESASVESSRRQAGLSGRVADASVKSILVAFCRVSLGFLDADAANLVGKDAAERRELAAADLFLRVPQVGADQRLATMKINLVGRHQYPAAGDLAVDRKRFEQRRIGGHLCASVDPQCLVDARDEEDRPDARACNQIAER